MRSRDHDVVEFGWEGDRPNTFKRLNAIPAKPTELSFYAGKCRNGELGIVWDLMIANGKLFITTSAGWRIPLDRVAGDLFEVGPWVLEFDRDDTGIRGIGLDRQRVYNLVFQRDPPAGPKAN